MALHTPPNRYLSACLDEKTRLLGTRCDLCVKEDARETLYDKTYYFKLAAYRVLFDRRVGGERDGEYVGLDFDHLRDLAAIDHMLRYTLLPMTLDIEHFAKAKLMREVTERADEAGRRQKDTVKVMPQQIEAALAESRRAWVEVHGRDDRRLDQRAEHARGASDAMERARGHGMLAVPQ